MGRNPRLRKWWDNNCSIEGSSKNKKKRLAIDRPTSSEEEQLFFGLPKSPEVRVFFFSFKRSKGKGFFYLLLNS